MTEPLIEFKTVTKRFGSRTILDRVNLKIYEGEITTIKTINHVVHNILG